MSAPRSPTGKRLEAPVISNVLRLKPDPPPWFDANRRELARVAVALLAWIALVGLVLGQLSRIWP